MTSYNPNKDQDPEMDGIFVTHKSKVNLSKIEQPPYSMQTEMGGYGPAIFSP